PRSTWSSPAATRDRQTEFRILPAPVASFSLRAGRVQRVQQSLAHRMILQDASATATNAPAQRWMRIIPVALIMYTISYIDRTNISLALDPNISTMMRDLLMDDRMKGQAAGIFFFGYILLHIPAGYLANRWSAKTLVAIFLVIFD